MEQVSADPPGEIRLADVGVTSAAAATPVVFAGHYGTLHRPPAGADRGVAVVLAAPIGREARSAYRLAWLFAEMLCARGVSVLRYDHLGTGDSAGLDPDADQWGRWVQGIEEAAAFARAHTRAGTLVLGGIRLGASLAAVAAERVRPEGLMLLAPVINGNTWVRELQFAASMFRRDAGEPAGAQPVDADAVRLSTASLAGLKRFDLRRLGCEAPACFLAAPDPALLDGRLGPQVTPVVFSDLECFSADAHVNVPPVALFEQAAAWVDSLPAQSPARAPAAPPEAVLAGADWIERPVCFGSGVRGVLCAPFDGPAARAVVFGNTGGDPRAGIGSFAALASRALAGRGVAALRFDFAGLGESAAAGPWRSHAYASDRTADLAAAADLLHAHGCAEVMLAGVCSGGYHALRTAVAGRRFSGVLAVNVARLVWRKGDAVTLDYEVDGRSTRSLLGAVGKASAWRRVLKGEVNLAALADTAVRRLVKLCARPLRSRETRRLRADVAAFCARGGRIRLVVGAEDPARDELEAHFGRDGRAVAALAGGSVGVVPGLDHGLFFPESRAMALDELLRFVDPAPPPQPARKPRLRETALQNRGASQAAM